MMKDNNTDVINSNENNNINIENVYNQNNDPLLETSDDKLPQEEIIVDTAVNTEKLNLPLLVKENTYIRYGTEPIYITPSNELIYRKDAIDTDVRSILYSNRTFFYIKNDNTLWGFGDNTKGILGDGTGVDRKIDNPVMIMENVAMVGQFRQNSYAITTNKELWVWGNNVYSPAKIADNIIKIVSNDGVFLRTDGTRWDINKETYVYPNGVYDAYYKSNTWYWIDSKYRLWKQPKLIPESYGVTKFYVVNDSNIMFIQDDNSLWGFGDNKNGELGDSTKLPRQDIPVKITDGITDISDYQYLTSTGEVWKRDKNNPTPQKFLENIYCIQQSIDGYILTDGQIANSNGKIEDNIIVKLPQELTFTSP